MTFKKHVCLGHPLWSKLYTNLHDHYWSHAICKHLYAVYKNEPKIPGPLCSSNFCVLWLVAVSFSNTAPAEGPNVQREQEQQYALLIASALHLTGAPGTKAAPHHPDTWTRRQFALCWKTPTGPTAGQQARMHLHVETIEPIGVVRIGELMDQTLKVWVLSYSRVLFY